MGLVLLLRGDEIAALTATEAVIRTRTGARQTYRRKPHDPLHPAERLPGLGALVMAAVPDPGAHDVPHEPAPRVLQSQGAGGTDRP